MIKDWFKNRLTPEKQKSKLWCEFTDSLQAVLESTVEPLLERISSRKSLFTMHRDDLEKRIAELGKFFIIRTENEKSKPVLLSQRLDEIHFKGTDRPISATFWREFKNLPASWEPLWAPIDQERFPYGAFFTTKDGVEAAKTEYGEFFLTSRGIIRLSLNTLYEQYGFDEQSELITKLTEQFEQVIAPLLPLEIVFNGFSLYIDFTIEEESELLTLNRINVMVDAKFNIEDTGAILSNPKTQITTSNQIVEAALRPLNKKLLRFDEMPLDAWALDLQITPPIIPTGTQTDERLKIINGKVTISTEGHYGCLVSFTDEPVRRYSFPSWADTATLPIDAQKLSHIEKITYCVLPEFLFYNAQMVSSSDSVRIERMAEQLHTMTSMLDERVTIENVQFDASLSSELSHIKFEPHLTEVRMDETPLDAWALDLNVLAPPVFMGDSRLREDDGKVILEMDGQRGCIVSYTDGSLNRYQFPKGVSEVSLPSDGIHEYKDIEKIVFA
ncbi:hypothetical protein NGK36_21790 [Hafnia alvei]|uniref:hypothetical protein n=1 Tax=Hafnia alvei TaxID=569 RepID=UPI002DBAF6CD|nr:hypothetical protein [Hafnia alvei]MEB7891895.1 hypothetical protein [Hafnia alvei]